MTYKYGTTILVKLDTKERIASKSKVDESFDTTINHILDKYDEYKEIYFFSKENRMIINRLLNELPRNKEAELARMKDKNGNPRIPIEIGLANSEKNQNGE